MLLEGMKKNRLNRTGSRIGKAKCQNLVFNYTQGRYEEEGGGAERGRSQENKKKIHGADEELIRQLC